MDGFIVSEGFIWKCVNSFKTTAEKFAYKIIPKGFVPIVEEEDTKSLKKKKSKWNQDSDDERPVLKKKESNKFDPQLEPEDI